MNLPKFFITLKKWRCSKEDDKKVLDKESK